MGATTITVSGSTFSQNEAVGTDTYGGAIYNGSSLTIKDNTTFTSNSAYQGGAIYVAIVDEHTSPESKLTVENGVIFDKNTADLFRYNVLEKGDSEDPMILYKNFRGAEPSLEPLLKNRGMK